MQCLDVLGCSILPLQLGCDVVLDDLDWLHLPVGSRQFTPQVPTQPWSADPKVALGQELMLEVTEEEWSLSCLKQILDMFTGPGMDLLEPPPLTSFLESSVCIVQPLLPDPSQETIA